MKKTFLLYLLLITTLQFIVAGRSFAQYSVSSNCVTTNVGSGSDTNQLPSNCQPGNSTGGGTGSIADTLGLAYSAEAMKQAYDFCGKNYNGIPDPGNTHVYSGIVECLGKYLSSNFPNFSPAQITAMQSRWASSLYYSPNPATDPRECSQCLGFAGISTALWTGATDNTLNFGCPAQQVGSSTIQIGSYTFKNIGNGLSAQIQSGDIGMSGSDPSCNGDAGHILIVKVVTGVQFTAIESNWGLTCHVTDNNQHTVDDYTFFRKE